MSAPASKPSRASRSADFGQWYLDVVRDAELASYAPVRGCIVVRPYGFALWENVRDALDRRIKETGHENIYMPLLVPESLLETEAEHVEGFSPQVAWVTHGGADELTERLAIRPTSEAMVGAVYRDLIQSYRDLPVLVNQWANVVRWELRTRPFLRTAEFLWQEGHTFHASAAEAHEEAERMLGVYREIWHDWLAVPTITGSKSEAEKFPGADVTMTGEALMGDRRALQMGTSHDLGSNFARAFDIRFLDRDNERRHPFGTSWGFSWRTIGAVIMVHGDERGLIVPPRIAPTHVVIVPIWRTLEEQAVVEAAIAPVEAGLRTRAVFGDQRIRVRVDRRDDVTPGFKFNDWELRGVPIRLEVGPRDVAAGTIAVVERLPATDVTDGTGAKESVSIDQIAVDVAARLQRIQTRLLERATTFQRANTHRIATWDELVEVNTAQGGFLVTSWCGSAACERDVQTTTGATLRVLPFEGEIEQLDPPTACVRCGASASETAVFARAY
jgi:prolyl-tRNA synthetase